MIRRVFLYTLLFLLVRSAAAEAFTLSMSRPDLSVRLSGIRTVGMVSPDIRIYEMSAGGVTEYKEDWSTKGKENVAKSLHDRFRGMLVEIRRDSLDNAVREELEDVHAVLEAAAGSYFVQSDAGNGFPVKRSPSDYVVGDLGRLFASLKVDALLVVEGRDAISTGGRKALATFGVLVGIALQPGVTVMNIGIVDRSGAILWYRSCSSVSGGDFRDPAGAAKLSDEVLSGFPGFKP